MRRNVIFKIMLILIVGALLLAVPAKAFATEDGAADVNDFFSDWETQDSSDLEPETKPEEKPNTEQQKQPETTTPEPETKPSTSTNTTTQKEEQLPHAGVVEDTIMVVSIFVLGAAAIYAAKKINYYKNV